MREHHALGHAGAAAREDHGGERRRASPRSHVEAVEQPRRAAGTRSTSMRSLRARRELLHHVFEEHHAVQRLDVRPSTRNCRDVRIVLMPHRSIAAAIDSRPGGEVQVDRRSCPPATAPMFASAPPTDAGSSRPTCDSSGSAAADPAREQQRADQRAAERQRLAWSQSAMQNDRQLMLRGPDELPAERLRPPAGARIADGRSRASCSASRTSAAVVVDGSGAPNATVTGYGTRDRPLPEEPAALEAEDAAPDAIEVDRHDRARRGRRRSARTRA